MGSACWGSTYAFTYCETRHRINEIVYRQTDMKSLQLQLFTILHSVEIWNENADRQLLYRHIHIIYCA